jgi:hypothetical protein
MKVKAHTAIFIAGAIGILSAGTASLAQDLPDDKTPSPTPRPSEVRSQFTSAAGPLEMLQQTVAANDVLLAKQADCMRQLAVLADKAQADKSAAHKSTSRGVKK